MEERNSEVASFDGRMGEPLAGLENLPPEVWKAALLAPVRTRFDVKPGTVVEEAVLRADEIVFHEGGDLTLGAPGNRFAVLWGTRVHFHNGAVQSAVRVAVPVPVNGTPGATGSRGRNGRKLGSDGGNGGPGGDGAPGAPGARVPDLFFIAGKVSFDREPPPGASPLELEARGVDGGNGGAGGAGGAGGDGKEGSPGAEEFEGR